MTLSRREFLATGLAALLTSANAASSNDTSSTSQSHLPIQSRVRIHKTITSTIAEATQIKLAWEKTVNSNSWLLAAPAGTWLCKEVEFTPAPQEFGGLLPRKHDFAFLFYYRIEGWGSEMQGQKFYSRDTKQTYRGLDFNQYFDFWRRSLLQ